MKKRILFIVVLFVLIGIGVVLWFETRQGAVLAEPNDAPTPLAGVEQSPTASPSNPTPATAQSVEKLTPAEQRIEVIKAWERAREKGVEFWGQVIDQYNKPVAGVVVTATITSHQIPSASVQPHPQTIYSVSTNANGQFYIKGDPGRGFTIETMKKAGYVLNPELQKRTNNLHWYNYDLLDPKGFKPDAHAPVVFRMWKLEKPEKLIEQRVRTAIPYDGTPVTYDLLVGHETKNGGDLRVTLMRNPQQIRWGQRNYEWTITFEAVHGGLIESGDEFMYLAPEDGYRSKVTINMAADAPQWTDEKTIKLYLKSRDGRNYGRVDLAYMVGSDRKETGFTYHSFINPNGSRNLEYDPTVQTQNLFPSQLHPPSSAPRPKP